MKIRGLGLATGMVYMIGYVTGGGMALVFGWRHFILTGVVCVIVFAYIDFLEWKNGGGGKC